MVSQVTARRGAVAAAERVYGVALTMLPRALRRRFGADMRATFAARCAEAAARGGWTLARLVAGELLDLMRASIAARTPTTPFALRAHASDSLVRRSHPVPSLLHDLRYAFRMLRRQPAFAAVMVGTLALGIGATTAVFTVVNGVLLRPLPYADPDRLLLLLNGRDGRLSTSFSPPNYRDVTADSAVFAAAAAFDASSVNLTGQGEPERVQAASVTGGFFSVLGVSPRLGRSLREDDVASNRRVVVVSDGFWRRRFGARPDIVGSVLRLDGQPFEVVGVAPAAVTLPGTPDVWRPMILSARDLSDAARGAQFIGVVARLKPAVTLEQANSAIALVADRLAREFPRTNEGRTMVATRLQERIVRGIRPALLVVLGAVSIVLLIACVNVANLLLARASARAHEVAVRAAVGAARSRLIAQFLVESLAVGIAGGLGGLAIAWSATRALVALGPASIPRLADVGIDARVLAFAAAAAIGTSLVFGLVPALATTGRPFARAIGSGRGSVGPAGARLRKVLVVAEMALAVVLLVGAGLLLRSYQRLSAVNPGFTADHVVTFHVTLPEAKYATAASVHAFVGEYVQRIAGTPGVETAAAVFGLPLDSDFSASTSFTRAGETDSANAPLAGMRIVTPAYFATLRIALRAGRLFTEHDDGSAAEAVIINEEAARRYWPNQNPLGQQIRVGVSLVSGVRSGSKTIVGVVGDVKYGGLDLTPPPELYLPYAQHPVDSMTVAIRANGDPMTVVPAARAALASLDRELPMADIRAMDELVGRSVAERRFIMLVLAAFAAVAVLLATVGVYGVLAYVVGQRTQEIGVRLAIGAAPRDVVRLFMREGARLALAGLIAGLAAAAAAARSLTALLFGVTTGDPVTFAAVAGGLAAIALAASYLPARRAARVDPMAALRKE